MGLKGKGSRAGFLSRRAAGLALAAWACPRLGVAGSRRPVAAGCISRIRLERHRPGEGPFTLELHRDGLAVLTRLGSGREGTEDVELRGRLEPARFAALARRVVALRFFDMAEVYEEPELRDGAWSATTVTCQGEDKLVFSRLDAGPAALKALEAQIAAQRPWIRPLAAPG